MDVIPLEDVDLDALVFQLEVQDVDQPHLSTCVCLVLRCYFLSIAVRLLMLLQVCIRVDRGYVIKGLRLLVRGPIEGGEVHLFPVPETIPLVCSFTFLFVGRRPTTGVTVLEALPPLSLPRRAVLVGLEILLLVTHVVIVPVSILLGAAVILVVPPLLSVGASALVIGLGSLLVAVLLIGAWLSGSTTHLPGKPCVVHHVVALAHLHALHVLLLVAASPVLLLVVVGSLLHTVVVVHVFLATSS